MQKPPSSAQPAELRRRAEARLREQKQLKVGVAQTGADIRRLLHELQVHQIELELQNAELRQARDELELALENYTDLYDFAPSGYFTLAKTGAILQANLTGATLVGIERSRLVGQSFGRLVSAGFRPAFSTFLEHVFGGDAKQSGDFELAGPGRPLRFVNIEAQCLLNGQECRVAVSDITARKLAVSALRKSEERYRNLFNSMDEGYCVIEMIFDQRQQPVDYRFEEVNRAFEKQTGLHNVVGKRMLEFVSAVEGHWLANYGKVALTGEPMRFDSEYKGLNRWFDVYAFRIGGNASRKVAILFNNITERKQAEAARVRLEVMTASNRKLEQEMIRRKKLEQALKTSERQLRRLSHEILLAQEAERKRISRELHDTVLQTLVGISVHLASLTPKPVDDPASLRRKIVQTQRLVDKSLAMVHRFAVELRPTVLDDLGLIPALHTFMKDFMKRTGVRACLSAYAAVNQLPLDQRAVLYRVALEALNNVAIHAQASAVKVEIKRLPDWICLTITDDGKSFDVKRVLRTKGNGRLGLLGMRERLEMVGGKFSIKSTPGQGTTVTARILPGQAAGEIAD